MCSHVESGVDIALLSKRKFSLSQCQDCAKDPGAKKSKVRSTLKKAARLADPAHRDKKIWICLACGHVACGTISGCQEDRLVKHESSSPSGHAWKHFLTEKHPLALQVSDTFVCWCFKCGTVVHHTCTLALSHNSSSNPRLAIGNNPLQDAADLVREKVTKRKGLLFEPMRSVFDTVKGVFDTATQSNLIDGLTLNHPSISTPCIRRKQSVKGLVNLGNTCFFNAVLQNLLALEVLRDYFSQEPVDSEGALTASMKRLYIEFNADDSEQLSMQGSKSSGHSGKSLFGPSSVGVCNPSSLFNAICAKAPHFKGFQQQDSHELLKLLLEQLILEEHCAKAVLNADQDAKIVSNGGHKKHTSTPTSQLVVQNGPTENTESFEEDGLNGSADKASHPAVVAPTFLESVLGGQFSSTVHCRECGHASVVYETMLDLSLQIPTKQAPKKRQVLENQGASPMYGGRSQKGNLYDAKGTNDAEPTPMQGTSSSEAPSSQCEQYIMCAVEAADLSEVLHERVSRLVHNPSPKEIADSSEACTNRDMFQRDNQPVGFQVPSPWKSVWRDSVDTSNLTSDGQHAKDDLHCVASALGSVQSGVGNGADIMITTTICSTTDRIGSPPVGKQLGSVSGPPVHELCEGNDVSAQARREDSLLLSTTGSVAPSNETQVDYNAGEESMSDFIDFAPEYFYKTPRCFYETDGDVFSTTSHLQKERGYESISLTSEEAESFPVTKQEGESHVNQAEANWVMEEHHFDCGSLQTGGGCEQLIYHEDTMATLSLEACLIDFTKSELLFGDDAWECANCSRAAERKAYPLDLNKAVTNRQVDCQDFLRGEEEGENTINQSNIVDHDVKQSASKAETFWPAISCEAELKNGSDDRDDLACTRDPQSIQEEASTSTNRLGMTSKTLSSSMKEAMAILSRKYVEQDQAKACQPRKLVKKDATKKLLISKPPLVLTLHLKRFAQDGQGRLNKLCGHVAFSEFLDLQPFLDPKLHHDHLDECVYRLVGIVEHGGTMRGGHYVAYVRGPHMEEVASKAGDTKDASWYYISDSSVRQTTLQDVLGRDAYLLFYEKFSSTKEER